jgi:hypothetical protein
MWMLWTTLVVLAPLAQALHQPPADRGAMVMGFDQEKTAHHFLIYDDGGAIDITVKDTKETKDTKDRDAIRSHLPHITTMFGAGDFNIPMLVHDAKDIPGVTVLSERKDTITYRYRETPGGGRVEMTTTDPQALKALHAFLRYQIHEHHTGDSLTMTRRK